MVSAGMDLEKPRPLHVFVGVRTSVTTGFFNMAENNQSHIANKEFRIPAGVELLNINLEEKTNWPEFVNLHTTN